MFCRITPTLIFAVLITVPIHGFALDDYHFPRGDVEKCYGLAMVGMDSVINSRIGVPPEHALDLARLKKTANKDTYSLHLLGTILDAYLWKDSPHSYAITVLYGCAQRDAIAHRVLTSAPTDVISSQ